jgi:peptide/nickel transport system permease protein
MKSLPLKIALLLTALLLLTSVLAPAWLEAWATERNLANRLLPPLSAQHLLGTDGLGRDLLARLLLGARHTFGIAALATLIAASIGILAGVLAAIGPRLLRTAVGRIIDLTIAFPSLVLAVAMVAALGRGQVTLALALGLFNWPVFARVTAAETRGVLTQQYVTAAKAFGVTPWRIVTGHVMPVIAPTLAVVVAFQFATLLISTAGLSFLGLGPGLGVPEWGSMLAEARAEMNQAPWLMLGPALAIAWTVLLMNSLGEHVARRSRIARNELL